MKDHKNYMAGVEVSEAEAAKGLGFASVDEFRRWNTDLGRKNAELEFALKSAIDERNRFRYVGRRMQKLLEMIAPTLIDPTLKLAVNVECGKAVDWDKKLAGWFDDIPHDPSPWVDAKEDGTR